MNEITGFYSFISYDERRLNEDFDLEQENINN